MLSKTTVELFDIKHIKTCKTFNTQSQNKKWGEMMLCSKKFLTAKSQERSCCCCCCCCCGVTKQVAKTYKIIATTTTTTDVLSWSESQVIMVKAGAPLSAVICLSVKWDCISPGQIMIHDPTEIESQSWAWSQLSRKEIRGFVFVARRPTDKTSA